MTSDTDMRRLTAESRPMLISYVFFASTLILVGWLHLATPLLTVLFCYFVIKKLHITQSKSVALILFSIVLGFGFYGFVVFLQHSLQGLPDIAEKSLPRVIRFAQENSIELPFDEDMESLKSFILEKTRHEVRYLGNFAKIATKEFVFLLIGVVVAASLFLNPAMDLEKGRHRLRNNLYTLTTDEIVKRFQSFYFSFETVMGAQIIIALINTAFTAIFTLVVELPKAPIIIGVTFLCGLLPIIGNIISNTVITLIAFTVSPKLAITALVFLIVLHKLEYFLNSKIIGTRIRNPVWLTLLGLILGERLMGVPGIILAPVVLHFIKVESSQVEVRSQRRSIAIAPRAEVTD